MNFDCSCMWVRDAEPLKAALSLTPHFLRAKGNALDYKARARPSRAPPRAHHAPTTRPPRAPPRAHHAPHHAPTTRPHHRALRASLGLAALRARACTDARSGPPGYHRAGCWALR